VTVTMAARQVAEEDATCGRYQKFEEAGTSNGQRLLFRSSGKFRDGPQAHVPL
jgi:hypothetical protein